MQLQYIYIYTVAIILVCSLSTSAFANSIFDKPYVDSLAGSGLSLDDKLYIDSELNKIKGNLKNEIDKIKNNNEQVEGICEKCEGYFANGGASPNYTTCMDIYSSDRYRLIFIEKVRDCGNKGRADLNRYLVIKKNK